VYSRNAKFLLSATDTDVAFGYESLTLTLKPSPKPNPKPAMSDCYIQAVPFFIVKLHASCILRLMLYLQRVCVLCTAVCWPMHMAIWSITAGHRTQYKNYTDAGNILVLGYGSPGLSRTKSIEP